MSEVGVFFAEHFGRYAEESPLVLSREEIGPLVLREED